VTPADLQDRIDAHALQVGRAVLPWVAALLAALAALYAVAPPLHPGTPYAALLAGAAAALGGLRVALGQASPGTARLLFLAAAVVVLAVPVGFLAGTGDPAQTVTLIIALIGVGDIFTSAVAFVNLSFSFLLGSLTGATSTSISVSAPVPSIDRPGPLRGRFGSFGSFTVKLSVYSLFV